MQWARWLHLLGVVTWIGVVHFVADAEGKTHGRRVGADPQTRGDNLVLEPVATATAALGR